jgi:GT2 family glycosyltransferase
MQPACVPPKATVTVVIVNYNGGGLVCDCLRALRLQTFGDFITVVIDNASTDESAEQIELEFPEVHLLRMQSNLGFAGGVNFALMNVQMGKWVALLNPDAFPQPTWIANLVDGAHQHPEFSAFGSRMYSDANLSILDGVGDAYHVSGLPWREGHGQNNTPAHENAYEIFSPCAAAALYETAALHSIGLFDEDFFCYVEDVDIGFRLRLAGYRCLYLPDATVVHLGSAVVGKHSDFQIYHGHRNLVWSYIKNMPSVLFWIFLPLHIALNLFTLCWFSVRGRGRCIYKAKCDAIKRVPYFWKKRKLIQQRRTASIGTILGQLRWNPFARYR